MPCLPSPTVCRPAAGIVETSSFTTRQHADQQAQHLHKTDKLDLYKNLGQESSFEAKENKTDQYAKARTLAGVGKVKKKSFSTGKNILITNILRGHE